MRLTSTDPKWRSSVRSMRIACPVATVAAVVLAYFAWVRGLHLALAINAFLAGINAALTWVQYRVFQP